jgi:acetyl-CoA carboxylase biotin carboxyl carrier protein
VNDVGPGIDGETAGETAGDADLLERVREAMVLLAGLPRSPEQLRIRVRGIEMELGWAAPAVPGPVATLVVPADPQPVSLDRAPIRPRVTAPIVGTFYRCPEPGAQPFVEVGDPVKPGQQVAIVEAMKLMVPVEADADGVIADILIEDGQPVAYGEALFELDPAS